MINKVIIRLLFYLLKGSDFKTPELINKAKTENEQVKTRGTAKDKDWAKHKLTSELSLAYKSRSKSTG